MIEGNWIEVKDGDPRVKGIQKRHYSAHQYKDGRRDLRIIGPGEHMILLTKDCRALFAWKYGHDSGYRWHGEDTQRGVCCTIFRNEGDILSSELIKEAVGLAQARWPKERLYTYVNPKKLDRHGDGNCFKKAGWNKCGHTKGGLIILEFASKE